MFKKLLSVALLFFAVATTAFAQSGTLTGTVTSAETGETLPAVNVVITELLKGDATDLDGVYSISDIVPGTYTVTVTYIGFSTIEQTLTISAGENVMDFQMSPDVGLLDEIVVSGVADNTPRKKLTVSVAKVDAAQLSKVPATSVSSALSGKVSGVTISNANGQPGGASNIQIRADNNLNVNSSPLIIIDGVILEGSMADINPDDMASIEVVKGAAASSLYGSRAGNGVIVMTSKRGALLGDGDVDVTIRNEVGVQQLETYIDLAESHAFALASDWESAKGVYTKYDGVTYPAGYEGGFHPDIVNTRALDPDHIMDNPFGVTKNPQEEFFSNGINYTNYVSLATRVSNINLFGSFENNSQEGIISNTDGYNRRNFRFNADWNLSDWLKVSASNMIINTTSNTPGGGGGIFFNIVLAEPDNNLKLQSPLDDQPYYIRHNHWSNEVNPLYTTWKVSEESSKQRYLGNFTATATPLSWLELKASYSLENNNYRWTTNTPYDTWSIGGSDPYGIVYSEGGLSKYSEEEVSQTLQYYLTTRQQFGKLYTKLTLSYLWENYEFEGFRADGNDYAIQGIPGFEAFDPADVSASSSLQTVSAENYFAIASFDWDDKYLFDGMIRRDGSSLFGPDSRWNNYYRISAAYRITEDIEIGFLDELKIRAAQGTAGIRPGYNWQYESFSINNGSASKNQLGNTELKPSKTTETEFAVNGTFASKFNFEVIYSTSVTDDQFLNVPLLPVTGYSSQYQNAGTIDSEAFEVNLNGNIIRNRDMSWDFGVTWSKTKQEISELDVPPYQSGPDGLYYIREGETYGAIYGYDWVTSLDQLVTINGEVVNELPGGFNGGDPNGDGVITAADFEVNSDGYVVPAGSQGTQYEVPVALTDENGDLAFVEIGNGRPDWTAGISNTFSFKGFSAYVLLDIKKGGDVYNRKSQWLTRDSRNGIMDMAGVADSEKKALEYYQGFYDVNTNNSYWVEDAGYLKFREVSLSYQFGQEQLAPIFGSGIKSATISAIGRNLLTFTKYSGYDPEVGTIRNPYDGTGTYPNFRNYALSISFKF